MNHFFIEIGLYFKDERLAFGLSQDKLAKRLGYTTPQFISNWERGLCAPPIKMINEMCLIFKINKIEVLGVMNRAQDKQFRSLLKIRT